MAETFEETVASIKSCWEWMKRYNARLERDLRDCRSELCLKCGKYHDAHKGACDNCRWKPGKKKVDVETNIYDEEELHQNCTVQILRNSVTGEVSVGWWENEEETE